MRYLKRYKVFESVGLSKSELIQDIDTLSKNLYNHIVDYNIKTRMNHNLHFSYANVETIKLMGFVTDSIIQSYRLNINSPDGLIRCICDEWIKIKNRFERQLYRNGEEVYPGTNQQAVLWKEYYKVGSQIEEMISGTRWDIPESKVLKDDDIDFITDSILSEYDSYRDFSVENYWDGVKVKITLVDNDILSTYVSITKIYESDFIKRLDSYFGGLMILNNSTNSGTKSNESYIVLYLPFWRKPNWVAPKTGIVP